MSKPLNVALIGFGNIGTGVVRHLQEHGDLIASRLPRPLHLRSICDRDLTRDRGVSTEGIRFTSDYTEVLADPEIEAVIELVGGTTIAHKIVTDALQAGKHVVMANKALIATYGGDLFETARKNRVHLLFEASVGAGIPLIRTMQSSLLPNRFTYLTGILNGTCNYILSAMGDQPGLSFEPVLEEAKQLGYAEPDPTLDIEGYDAAHKIAIMGSLAFGRDLRIDDVVVQGITRIDGGDFAFAHLQGQTIKLLASAQPDEDGSVALSVWPSFVPRDHLIGGVTGVTNTLWIDAEPVGPTMYTGAGAGQGSTSSGVLSDLCHLAQGGDYETIARFNPIQVTRSGERQKRTARHPRRYLRVRTTDPDVLIGALGFDVLNRTAEAVAFAAPEQDEKERAALLAKIASHGIAEADICEIRVALQDEGAVLDQGHYGAP